MDILKGMSFNVTLSNEQIEQIAEITSEKVKNHKNYYMDEVEHLRQEVQDLRKEIERRDNLVVKDLLREDWHKDKLKSLIEKNKKLTEEIKKLKGEDE